MMNRKGFGRKRLWPNRDIILEGLRKSTKDLTHDSRCPSLDSNRTPPEYKLRALPLSQTIRPYIGYKCKFQKKIPLDSSTAHWTVSTMRISIKVKLSL
jgi:hypothetical protein